MNDREKIKIALKECVRQIGYGCDKCPYRGKSCVDRLHLDILAFLKEQEAVVRCKDCIHKNGLNHCPHNNDIWVADNWYCADGVKGAEQN